MKVYLREIHEGETELDFTQDDNWVWEAVHRVDEDKEEIPVAAQIHGLRENAAPINSAHTEQRRPVTAHFSLSQVDEVVVISGEIRASISLICSRCVTPFQFHARPSFSGLFCKDPVMAGVGYLTEAKRPAGQNKGHARHAHDSGGDDLVSQGKDLDITYLSNDYVDLGEVLTEHLQLQVPFQPLCKEDCKGICSQCGADLNTGRCACAKIASSTPFSVLKNLKVQ